MIQHIYNLFQNYSTLDTNLSWILISLIELGLMEENMNPLVFGSQPSSRGSLLKELCLKAPIHRVNSMGLGIAEKDRLIK